MSLGGQDDVPPSCPRVTAADMGTTVHVFYKSDKNKVGTLSRRELSRFKGTVPYVLFEENSQLLGNSKSFGRTLYYAREWRWFIDNMPEVTSENMRSIMTLFKTGKVSRVTLNNFIVDKWLLRPHIEPGSTPNG